MAGYTNREQKPLRKVVIRLGKTAHTRRPRGKRWTRDDWELTLLATPTFIWYLLFSFLPMFGIIIAFKKIRFRPGQNFIQNIITSDWCGLKNFEFLFKSNDAFIILRNTILYNIVFVVLGIVIPVTLAIAINELRSKKLAKTVQTAMFLPYFMSWIVVTYFVGAFLNFDKGLLNTLLESMGKDPVQWYREPAYWPGILIFLNVWKGMGYGMVIYLATITGFDTSYYEAAVIDGATKWQQIRYISLPLLKPVIIMMFILNIGRIFYSDFGLFYQVPKASPSLFSVTETLDVYIYRALSNSTSISMPSAAAFIQSVMGCLTILSANWLVRRVDKESAIF